MFTSFLIEFVKFRSSSFGRGPIAKIKIYTASQYRDRLIKLSRQPVIRLLSIIIRADGAPVTPVWQTSAQIEIPEIE